MSILTRKFLFLHNKKRSRDYLTVVAAVSNGMRRIRRPGGEYQVDGGDGFGPPKDFTAASKRARHLVRKVKPGEQVVAVATVSGVVVDRVRFRATESLPAEADVPGTPLVKQWVGCLRRFWPKARLAGTVVCKRGGHALGEACDDFDTPENMEAQYHFAIDNAEELGTRYVIYLRTIWTAGPPWTESSRGEHPYTGEPHYHVHFSARDGKCGVYCTPGYGDCAHASH